MESYKTVVKIEVKVKPAKKVVSVNDWKELVAKILSLPDADAEWSKSDELLDDEVTDLLELYTSSVGIRSVRSNLKAFGLSNDKVNEIL